MMGDQIVVLRAVKSRYNDCVIIYLLLPILHVLIGNIVKRIAAAFFIVKIRNILSYHIYRELGSYEPTLYTYASAQQCGGAIRFGTLQAGAHKERTHVVCSTRLDRR